jgi:invasion protein IalB
MKTMLAFAFMAALTMAASAQTAPSSPTPAASPAQIVISGWRLDCATTAGTFACQLVNRVSLRSNNAVVGAVAVHLSGDGKSPLIDVQVPLGIALAPGVHIGTASGALQAVSLVRCRVDGCYARSTLGEPLLNAMRAAKEPLQIAYETFDANDQPQTITIRLGLNGFGAGYDKLHP